MTILEADRDIKSILFASVPLTSWFADSCLTECGKAGAESKASCINNTQM